ncbi:MAG: hypothetical protein ABSH40_00280 [Bryobacteraceae bacterium]
MFRNFFSRKPAALTGAPPVRRMKTYSAQSGYVYQYYYEGHRAFRSAGESGSEFVFTISADRKCWSEASVHVSDQAVAHWERSHARQLPNNERYAIAKMALFQAFDDRSNPGLMKEAVRVRPADVEAIVETLDL